MLLADHKSLEEGGITSTLGVSQDPPQGSQGGPHAPELTEEKGHLSECVLEDGVASPELEME